MEDISNYEHVVAFTDLFYQYLAQDDLLKDIFFQRLGEVPPEQALAAWKPHLERVYAFWETVLLGTTSYKGQSFLPHASMDLHQEHFDRWLALFNKSIDTLFEGPKASEAKQKANTMAILFMSKINYNRENGGIHLV
jgi:hemoglobin